MAGQASRENGKKGGRPRKQPTDPSISIPVDDRPLQADVVPDPPWTLAQCGLTQKDERFVLEYLIDGNATRAYQRLHPECSLVTAQSAGPEIARKPHIQKALADVRRQQWLRLQMTGDEALARIANVGRADIADTLGADDPIRQLPEHVRRQIKAIRPTQFGRVLILHDALAANELIAKATGKLHDEARVAVVPMFVLPAGSQPAVSRLEP